MWAVGSGGGRGIGRPEYWIIDDACGWALADVSIRMACSIFGKSVRRLRRYISCMHAWRWRAQLYQRTRYSPICKWLIPSFMRPRLGPSKSRPWLSWPFRLSKSRLEAQSQDVGLSNIAYTQPFQPFNDFHQTLFCFSIRYSLFGAGQLEELGSLRAVPLPQVPRSFTQKLNGQLRDGDSKIETPGFLSTRAWRQSVYNLRATCDLRKIRKSEMYSLPCKASTAMSTTVIQSSLDGPVTSDSTTVRRIRTASVPCSAVTSSE